jgi:hypothetical protein
MEPISWNSFKHFYALLPTKEQQWNAVNEALWNALRTDNEELFGNIFKQISPWPQHEPGTWARSSARRIVEESVHKDKQFWMEMLLTNEQFWKWFVLAPDQENDDRRDTKWQLIIQLGPYGENNARWLCSHFNDEKRKGRFSFITCKIVWALFYDLMLELEKGKDETEPDEDEDYEDEDEEDEEHNTELTAQD